MTEHYLGPDRSAMTDMLCAEAPPVLVVDPGDTVVVQTLDAWGHLERPRTPEETAPLMFPDRRGHCLAGPIAVRGARPGQLLAVRIEHLRPDVWGWTRAGGRDDALHRALGTADVEAAVLLWTLDPDAATGTEQHGVTVPLAPFLGVIGMPPDATGEHSTVPPRALGGGNIDCRDLTAGSTLYLPVPVPDAYVFVGDGHAAQGHGEVAGTAIECGMTSRLTLELVEPGPVDAVHAETPAARITFGFDADLNVATAQALAAMLTWMQALLDVDRTTALALASPLVDLHITQIANRTWGVHASLRRSASPREWRESH